MSAASAVLPDVTCQQQKLFIRVSSSRKDFFIIRMAAYCRALSYVASRLVTRNILAPKSGDASSGKLYSGKELHADYGEVYDLSQG